MGPRSETLAIRLRDGHIAYGADIGWSGVFVAALLTALNWAFTPLLLGR